QSNINVALTVAGTNTFTDNQVISSLAPGATAIVSFAPYTPSTLSSGDIITVTATASGDQNPANDSRNWSQDVTPNVYTYKNTAVGNNGGVGFNGATGDFVAKFNSHIGANPPYNVYSPQINEIKVDLTTSGQQYQLGIWDATGPSATPGVNLWTSPILTSAVGTAFVPVPNVSVNGDYYVGVRQIGTVNVGFAFQNESPIRPGTFFYTSPTGSTTWTDFATSSSPFRFAIEVTVHIPVPPACAINFSPADNSNLVCSNPILSWGSGGGAPTGYDVYFSTNATDVLNHAPAALVSTNQPGTTYSPAMSSFTTYYWSIIPQNADGPATGCGMQSFTTGSLPNCYCIPTHTGTLCDGAISQVDFNTLSNNATCAAPGYAVFNPTGSLTTTVQQGGTYTMNVTTISSDIISMWIDYNQNGIIDTTEWNQISTASTANTPASALITIPMTALTGNTLMRIRSRFTGNNNYGSDACTNFGSGSSQDYIITIIPPVPCSGTPNPGNTLASATAVCPGNSVNFFLQNQTSGTGVTYQWYNNAGLITGATNNTYTGVITIPDDFYCEVTCGGNTTPSNLISIGLSNFLTCYCIPTTTNGCLLGDHITNVSVATFANPINNASGTCLVNSYSDYTSLTAQASQGDQVAISVEVNNGGTEYAAGWIDFNHS
ncbi:MAG TPA: GEVED domain-containing protein, partial [Chitinophagaceae bacterium]|nr:GEVED domain-containing protein [Chitinophagaceae bacterium]